MNSLINPRDSYLTKNKEDLQRYLAEFCWEGHARFCIRCKAKKVYRIRRERYRCSECAYEFSDLTGRWINKVKLGCESWLSLIRLFEGEISARKASQETGISYPTVLKAFFVIRRAIAAHAEDGDEEADGLKGVRAFAKVKMREFRRISRKNFPLYLKEMEFRFNHRGKSIFDTLLGYLCDFFPREGENHER